jgi:fatty acid desaturase
MISPETARAWMRIRREPDEPLLHYVLFVALTVVAVAAVGFATVSLTISWSLLPLLICTAIYVPAAVAVIADIIPGGKRWPSIYG